MQRNDKKKLRTKIFVEANFEARPRFEFRPKFEIWGQKWGQPNLEARQANGVRPGQVLEYDWVCFYNESNDHIDEVGFHKNYKSDPMTVTVLRSESSSKFHWILQFQTARDFFIVLAPTT